MRKLLFVLGLVAGCFSHSYQEDVITNEIVVDFNDDVSPEYIAELGKKLSITFAPESKYSSHDKIYVGEYTGNNETGVIETLRHNSNVEAADADMIYTIPEHNLPVNEEGIRTNEVGSTGDSFPNDPLYQKQWHLKQVHLPESWVNEKTTGKGVIVAILDTGLSMTEDIKNASIVKGYNFVDNNEDTTDGNSHGTFVSGVVAQNTNNKIGVAGIAYEATIMPIKVLSDSGSGSLAGITQGIDFAVDSGAKIINMSLGGGGYTEVMAKAIERAHKKGVLVICAAGNSARGEVSYPAKYKYSIAVAALNRDEKTTRYSNWGKEIKISIAGGEIIGGDETGGILQNTIKNGKDSYYYYQGTSFSSPIIAAVAAMVVSTGITDPDEVITILTKTAREPNWIKNNKKPSNYSEHYGAGIADAAAAIKMAQSIKSTGIVNKIKHNYLWVFALLLGAIMYFSWRKNS